MKILFRLLTLCLLTACAREVPRVKNDKLVRAELVMPEGQLTDFTVTQEFSDFNIQSKDDRETAGKYGFLKVSYVQKHFVKGDGAFLHLGLISDSKDVNLRVKADAAYYQINNGEKHPFHMYSKVKSSAPANYAGYKHYYVTITDADNRKRRKIRDGDVYQVHLPFVFNENDFTLNVYTKLKIAKVKAVKHVPGTP